jgi:diacylglycerol kinase family enzyme
VRVLLLHNPNAGTADHDAERLCELLLRSGHHVDYHSTRDGFIGKALRRPCDMVVVAGGDGTIGKVIKRLPDRRVPVAPVPLGTANNIAGALGIRHSPEEVIAGLHRAGFQVLTVGRVRSLGEPVRFLESVGFGAIARAMRDAHDRQKRGAPKLSVDEARAHLIAALRRAPAESFVVRTEGRTLRINGLFLEVMNLGSFGPGLRFGNLHPGAHRLDVVWVEPDDRKALLRWLEADAANIAPPVRRLRCTRVKVWAGGGLTRIDDRFVEADRRVSKLAIRLEREPVRIATPREAGAA